VDDLKSRLTVIACALIEIAIVELKTLCEQSGVMRKGGGDGIFENISRGKERR
jgi:hypothetical protein